MRASPLGLVAGRLLREPMVRFLLLGAALFGLHAAFGRRSGEVEAGGGEIVVTRGRIRSLAETFSRLWNRPPSQQEFEDLVREYVREEVLAREALALGLDDDDTIVRRRLAQKMEFLFEGVAELAKPTDEDLEGHLTAHPESFRLDSRLSFGQICLDPVRHGDSLETDAAQLLDRLESGGSGLDPAAVGDSRLLAARFVDVSCRDVEAQFGPGFAARLDELPLERWIWPVESGFGVHLVRIEERTPGQLPALDDVREAVAREWTAARRAELKEAHYLALLARYTVTIEEPPAPVPVANAEVGP